MISFVILIQSRDDCPKEEKKIHYFVCKGSLNLEVHVHRRSQTVRRQMWGKLGPGSTTKLHCISFSFTPSTTTSVKHHATMTSLYAFPLFAQLPYELRLKVWECALPGPRIVPVRYNRTQKQYTSGAPPPILLHICTESRHKFLSIYEKFKLSQSYESSIFVDFTRDTIFFDSLDCSPEGDLAYDLAMSPQSQKVLYCAIDAQLWEVLRVFRHDNLSEVKILKRLKTLWLVLRQDYDRGLRQTRMLSEGREMTQVEVVHTVGSEIQHVHFNVDSIRWDLEHEMDPKWEGGQAPNVQMLIM